jgi:4-hydroxy-4-methyl-2-oxoglutarate aldolase
MKRAILTAVTLCLGVMAGQAMADTQLTREQVIALTPKWTGERFADGRPKVPDDLLKRVVALTLEDIWDPLRDFNYINQFENDWQMLHPEQPFAGRAVTMQYMPSRPDLGEALRGSGRGAGGGGMPVAMLQNGDVLVADGYGKIAEGTLTGSNGSNNIYNHTHDGFVFYGSVRDTKELREIKGFNGLFKDSDPSPIANMQLTQVNGPVRIGRAVVLPGDLVYATRDGVLFIPAEMANLVISEGEFLDLEDDYNFQVVQPAQAKAGQASGEPGGWSHEVHAAFAAYIHGHPNLLKMTPAEFDALEAKADRPRVQRPPVDNCKTPGLCN